MFCVPDTKVLLLDSYAMTPIQAQNLSNVDVLLKGNIHLPQDISYVQGIGKQICHLQAVDSGSHTFAHGKNSKRDQRSLAL